MNLVDRQLRPARPDAPAHPDSFLRWAEGREGRYELVEGQIVMMTGGSKNHAVITLRIGALLPSQLDQTIYQICAADLGVRTKAGVRYPDIVVDTAEPGSGSSLSASSPVFIAEVLSPSSVAIDMIEKSAEYMAIGSVLAYAVFSQDEPRAWIWSRDDTGWPEKPIMVEGADSLAIPTLGLMLPLASIYREIGPASASSPA